jgi:hypothetical protein
MNKIDNLIEMSDAKTLIDGKWVIARPLNNRRAQTTLRKRVMEALNVLNGKAETLYYYKQ